MGVLRFIEFRSCRASRASTRARRRTSKKKTVFLSTKLPLVEKEADAIIALKPGPGGVMASEDEMILPSFWDEKGKDRSGEEAKQI